MRFMNSPRWTGNVVLAHRAARIATCVHKHQHPSEGAARAHYRALERRFGSQVPTLAGHSSGKIPRSRHRTGCGGTLSACSTC